MDGSLSEPLLGSLLADWRHVHNVIVPPAALSPGEVRERAGRFLLEVAANTEGLRFAHAHGYVESDRYVLPGGSALWIDLRLA